TRVQVNANAGDDAVDGVGPARQEQRCGGVGTAEEDARVHAVAETRQTKIAAVSVEGEPAAGARVTAGKHKPVRRHARAIVNDGCTDACLRVVDLGDDVVEGVCTIELQRYLEGAVDPIIRALDALGGSSQSQVLRDSAF